MRNLRAVSVLNRVSCNVKAWRWLKWMMENFSVDQIWQFLKSFNLMTWYGGGPWVLGKRGKQAKVPCLVGIFYFICNFFFFFKKTDCSVFPKLCNFWAALDLALEANFKWENWKCSTLVPVLHGLELCSALTVGTDRRKRSFILYNGNTFWASPIKCVF